MRTGSLANGVSLGNGTTTAGLGCSPRVTPAALAHRLTQLCGTSCFFDAAITPLARTSATTASRCSLV
jgi:hypothetical protein